MNKIVFRIITAIVLIISNINIFAQETNLDRMMRTRNEYYFSIKIDNKSDINAINKIVSVDKVVDDNVICYANNRQYDNIIAAGYTPTLLTPPSMLEDHAMFDGTRATYEWDSYPTYSAYEAMMSEYDSYSNCNVMTLGTLSSGRKLLVAHINNGQPEGKPKFLYTSTIHGDETTGWIMMLRLIDLLLTSNDARVQNIVNNLDIFICPNTNPDGTYYGGNNTINGARRYNASGIDMNRNYPDFDDGQHPDGNAYANETQWLMQFAEDYVFTMGANYHGGAEVMNYPWDTYQGLHVDDEWWKLVSREYADKCHEVSSSYLTDLNNGITNGYAWYTMSGGRQDYMNYYAECREITIECSTTKSPSGSQLPNFWNYNKESILSYMEQAINGIHGIVTDSETGNILTGVKVKVLNHDENYSMVTSHEAGDYHRVIKGGTYTLQFTKEGYCPVNKTVTVGDGERVDVDVQMTPGDCILADFTADRTFISAGQTVNFTDLSDGININSWAWQFQGGTPATSSQQNPSVTYNTPGTYTVTLTAASASANDTETKTGYINVVESEFNMSDGTFNKCNALFYDNNGPSNNYSNNKNITTVIYPDDANATLQVIFTQFETEEGYDFLYIHDGASTNSTLIGSYSGTNSPGTVTASTIGGALTFHFVSDQYVDGAGWVAQIKCLIDSEPLAVEATSEDECVVENHSTHLSATATGGTGNYTYSWEPANTLDDPYSQSPTATPTENTTYTVTVSDGNTTATASVSVCVTPDGTTENNTNAINIYPNPTYAEIHIKTPYNTTTTYRIYNNMGQEVYCVTGEGNISISTDTFSKGLYIIEICNTESIYMHKIMVK